MEFSFGANVDSQRKKYGLQPVSTLSATRANPLQAQAPPSIFSQSVPKAKPNPARATMNERDRSEREVVKEFLDKNKKKYAEQVVDQASKALAEDPKAFEYDSLYDSMQMEKERKLLQRVPEKVAHQINFQKARYLGSLLKAKERRDVEQITAWENMEKIERLREVESGLAAPNTEKFITNAYREQLEANKKYQAMAEVEEKINQKKGANKETGMMGFYKNLMTKNKNLGEAAVGTLDFIEQKIQTKEEEHERRLEQWELQRNLQKEVEPEKKDAQKPQEVVIEKHKEEKKKEVSRSRSRDREEAREKKEREEAERERKKNLLKERFKQRKHVEIPEEEE